MNEIGEEEERSFLDLEREEGLCRNGDVKFKKEREAEHRWLSGLIYSAYQNSIDCIIIPID